MSETKTVEQPTTEADVVKRTGDAPIVKQDLDALSKVKVAGELDLLTAAKAFAASGMFPDIHTQSQAVVKIVAGYELGVKPFAAMRGIHFITFRTKDENDRWKEVGILELSANLRGALIKRSGVYTYRQRALDAEHCVLEFFEKSPMDGRWESVGFSEYSVAQAAKAGLTADRGSKKSNWILYPEDMCFAAALRRGARRFCPDLFVGDQALAERDDATIVAQAAERELATEGEVVDGEIVNDERTFASTEGGEGADVAPGGRDAKVADASAPEVAPPPSDEHDPSPTDDTPSEEDAEGVYVGFLLVPPAPGGPYKPAEDRAELRTKDDIAGLHALLNQLNLIDGSLDTIFKARYGVSLSQGTRAQARELHSWLQTRVALSNAKS